MESTNHTPEVQTSSINAVNNTSSDKWLAVLLAIATIIAAITTAIFMVKLYEQNKNTYAYVEAYDNNVKAWLSTPWRGDSYKTMQSLIAISCENKAIHVRSFPKSMHMPASGRFLPVVYAMTTYKTNMACGKTEPIAYLKMNVDKSVYDLRIDPKSHLTMVKDKALMQLFASKHNMFSLVFATYAPNFNHTVCYPINGCKREPLNAVRIDETLISYVFKMNEFSLPVETGPKLTLRRID